MVINSRFFKRAIILLNVAYFFVLLLYFYLHFNSFDNNNWANSVTPFIIVGLALNAGYFLLHRIRIFDYRFVFIVLSYLFMFGRVFYAWLGKEYVASWWLQDYFLPSAMYHACAYILISVQACFIGFFAIKNKQSHKDFLAESSLFVRVAKSETRSLFISAIVVLCIGLPSRLFMDFRAIWYSSQTGWYEAGGGVVGFIDDFAFFFIPGIFLLLESFESDKKKKIIIFLVFIYFFVVMILTGDRRYYVSGLLALGCYYLFRLNKKRSIIFYLFVIFVCIFTLNLIEIVRHNRYGGITSLGIFLSNNFLKLFDFSNTFDDVFTEFGISFYSVVVAVNYVPNKLLTFQYGKTFIYALLSIIPLGGYLAGDFSSPSDYINERVDLPLGGTFFGDLYINFGYTFGIVFAFLIAFLIGKYFTSLSRKRSGIGIAYYFSSFYILINLVRATFYEVARPLVWMLILVSAVFYFSKKRKHLSYGTKQAIIKR